MKWQWQEKVAGLSCKFSLPWLGYQASSVAGLKCTHVHKQRGSPPPCINQRPRATASALMLLLHKLLLLLPLLLLLLHTTATGAAGLPAHAPLAITAVFARASTKNAFSDNHRNCHRGSPPRLYHANTRLVLLLKLRETLSETNMYN